MVLKYFPYFSTSLILSFKKNRQLHNYDIFWPNVYIDKTIEYDILFGKIVHTLVD